MASTNVMEVEVKSLTKFGFQNEKGEYVNYSKTLKDAEKSQIVPGRKFSVEMYVADSGKQYVNKVLRQLEGVVTPPLIAPVFAKTPVAKAMKPKDTETMSKAEWAEKDIRISRQGIIQASVQAIANLGMADAETLFPMAEELANKMLEFVNRK